MDNWFEGSRVVKKDGSPRPVYHGTETGDFESFHVPAFFSASREEAEAYAMYMDTYGDTKISYEPVGDRELPNPSAFNEWPIMSDYDGPPNKIALTGESGNEDDEESRYFYWDGTVNALGDKNFVVLSGVRVVSSGFGPTFRMEIEYGPTKDPLSREPRRIPRRLYTCYLSIKNPLQLPWQEANLLGKRLGADPDSVQKSISKWESEGYDGIVTVSDAGIVYHNVVVTNWIAFRPEQVKIVNVENLEDYVTESLSSKVLSVIHEIEGKEEKTEEQEACEEDALEVIRTLQKAGYQAVFAGGCVRDRAMGADPHDYDVATSATTEEVQKLFPKIIHVGEVFGVTRVVMPSGVVEVATFRKESEYEKGRRPKNVSFTDMKTDAERRDFTINAMFHDPVSDEIHDYVGGMADIKNRVLRFVGDADERIKEDHLRMLRLVRFAAKLGFTPDESSVEAVKRNVDLAQKISAERVRDEMTKMLTGPHPDKAMEMMQETGLMRVLIPEVAELNGVEQDPGDHPEGDVFKHTMAVLSNMKKPSPVLAWSALLHDTGKKSTYAIHPKKDKITFHGHEEAGAEDTKKILRRLKFPNKEIDEIVWLVINHMKIKDFFKMKDPKKAALVRNPMFNDLLLLTSADSGASGHEDVSSEVREYLKTAPERISHTEPLINGNDLKDLGLRPGPEFKKILDKVAEKQIEGSIETREEAIKFATQMARSLGGKPTEGLAKSILGITRSVLEQYQVTEEDDKAYLDAISRRDFYTAYKIINKVTGRTLKSSDRGEEGHSPADPDTGAPAWSLDGPGTYPKDVYTMGIQYYGTGEDSMDREAYSIIQNLHNSPRSFVKIYRAVPKGVSGGIRPGDWVTTVRRYATEHGKASLKGDYRILSKLVHADDIYTAGDSWLEWGYHPQEPLPRIVRKDAEGKVIPLSVRFGAENEAG